MFNGLQLTNKGIELLTNLLNGHRVQFTSIKMGDGAKPSNVLTLNSLVNVRQTLPVARNSKIDEKTMLIGANLYGSLVTAAFYWREVGLFAKDLDGDNIEYLFSYDNAGDLASYIPAGGAVTEQLIDLNVIVGNAENVVIEVDSSLVYVTQDELDETLLNLKTTLETKINTDVKAVNDALTNHKNNEENPHKVTKSQVGLGNVPNYGMASSAEAKAGVLNDKLMTPIRVREEIEALGVISDGNVIIKIGSTQPAVQNGKTIIWINTGS